MSDRFANTLKNHPKIMAFVVSIVTSLLMAFSPLIAIGIGQYASHYGVTLVLMPLICLGAFALALSLPSYFLLAGKNHFQLRLLIKQDVVAVIAGFPFALLLCQPLSLLEMIPSLKHCLQSTAIVFLPFMYFSSVWFIHCRLASRLEITPQGFSRDLWTIGGVASASGLSGLIFFVATTTLPAGSQLGFAVGLFSSAFLYVALPMIAFILASKQEHTVGSDN